MSPSEISEHRQLEREERRLGMSSLDPQTISRHFARARELREILDRSVRPHLVSGAAGTKGASSQPPV